MSRGKWTVLVSLLSLALALQATPAFALMIGCPMGSTQASCSKWSEARKPCCCAKVAEPPKCKMAKGCDKPSPQLLKEKQDAGCKCQVITAVMPDRAAASHFAFHDLPIAVAVVPAIAPLEFGTRVAEPAIFGTDSSPPRRAVHTPSQPRAPPIDPA